MSALRAWSIPAPPYLLAGKIKGPSRASQGPPKGPSRAPQWPLPPSRLLLTLLPGDRVACLPMKRLVQLAFTHEGGGRWTRVGSSAIRAPTSSRFFAQSRFGCQTGPRLQDALLKTPLLRVSFRAIRINDF